MRENQIANGDFISGRIGDIPDGWEAVCPNEALAPTFALIENGDGSRSLMAVGNGRRECFGYVRHAVRLEGKKNYRLRVRLRFEGMEDLNRHLVHGVFAPNFNDGIFTYQRDTNGVISENCFPAPDQTTEGEVRLYFRFSSHGKVWWDSVSLEACDPLPSRIVKIACSPNWRTNSCNVFSLL